MAKALIKLAWKQVIDARSEGDFERKVFNASYQEFLLKSQAYNMDREFKTFTEMKINDGRANSLHYKLSFALGHFIAGLNNKIPGLRDNAGNNPVFEVPRFELLESDITDKAAHKVAIHYCTGVLTLLDTIEDYLVLAVGDTCIEQVAETFTLKMRPGLSVIYYKPYNAAHNTMVSGQDILMNV